MSASGSLHSESLHSESLHSESKKFKYEIINPVDISEDELFNIAKDFDFLPIRLPEVKEMELIDKVIRVIVRIGKPFTFFISKYDSDPRELYQIPDAQAIFLAACKRGILGLFLWKNNELDKKSSTPNTVADIKLNGEGMSHMLSIAIGEYDGFHLSIDTLKESELITESVKNFTILCKDLIK